VATNNRTEEKGKNELNINNMDSTIEELVLTFGEI